MTVGLIGVGLHPVLRLNLGGEGEEAHCINQQPPWMDLSDTISRNGQPLRSISRVGIPVLFCDNVHLPFPDSTVDCIFTNNVPIDLGTNFLGPTLDSTEIKRVLKSGGTWYDNGILVHTKP